ncbi:MAG: TetR/AcrR family transcriptional regulator [Alphaproteobacteria bacterium]|nr:TetR/AcrR family transcriptional regulator [Alphaproteobacteria bacterium]
MDAQTGSTARYNKKKEAIIAAAVGILNRRGVRGMTLADVAASVDLITTSVTYYFRKKEDLAVACYLRSIERFQTLAAEALTEADPRARLNRFLESWLALHARIREGDEAPIAVFGDIRALREPQVRVVSEAYGVFFRKLRSLFNAPGHEWLNRRIATVRTHMLLEQIYWSTAWLPRYELMDYPRVSSRMFEILDCGIARDGAVWAPLALAFGMDPSSESPDKSRETFLTAATRLINQRGYRGASVEKISRELNVTKGSFYHHNETKDELVVECFERSFATMRAAQSAALAISGDCWLRISSAAAALADFQLSDRGPLLRTSALAALPEQMRLTMVELSNRVSERFAAMISDGVAETSLRAVDPYIAAQMLNATLNGASDLRFVLPDLKPNELATLCARPMLMGIFSR